MQKDMFRGGEIRKWEFRQNSEGDFLLETVIFLKHTFRMCTGQVLCDNTLAKRMIATPKCKIIFIKMAMGVKVSRDCKPCRKASAMSYSVPSIPLEIVFEEVPPGSVFVKKNQGSNILIRTT